MNLFRMAALTAIFTLLLSGAPTSAIASSALIGKPAPSFDLERSDSGRLSLASLKGRVVILSFWATWCAPCKAEMPALEAAYQKYASEGVTVVGINFQQEKPQVAKFIAANKISFPIAMDEDGKAADVYSVPGLPTTFFIDKDGLMAGRHEGVVSPEILESWITKLNNRK